MDTKKDCMPTRCEPEEPSPIDQHIGQNLQIIRLRAGKTLAWLGFELGVSTYQIEGWESGRARVPAACLLACSTLLCCRLTALFEGLH